ncbi:hypothetical protein [Okeania sp.]|uniref:hypothetical protein n=1 Tax=Okeania sp. TaxID=3100323 RepID=UPI002B4B0089|nr:hypothetical protein [Okeania sp.]MEB3340732.1 hypothetical protein [Okeania sp.]
MFLAYLPIIKFYRLSPIYAMGLPTVALIYILITIDSARRHWRKRNNYWQN